MTITTRPVGGSGPPRSIEYYGVTPVSSATVVTAALTAAVDDINAGVFGHLFLPEGDWRLNAALPAITAANWSIRGGGPKSRIAIPSNISSLGTFFTLGSTATRTSNGYIGDMAFVCSNTPSANAFCVDLVSATNVNMENIGVSGISSIIRYGNGSAALSTTRCTFRNWSGLCQNGADSDANIDLVSGSSGRFERVRITASAASTNGTLVRLAPATGCLLDTFHFVDFGMQIFSQVFDPDSEPSLLSPDGKPYGLTIDPTHGNVQNIWFIGGSFCDHTRTAGARIASTAGGTGYLRNIQIINSRFTSDDGSPVVVDHQAGTLARSIYISHNRLGLRSDEPAASIAGSGFKNCYFSYNICEDSNASVAKPRAVLLASDGWSVKGNQIGTMAATTAYAAAVEISGTGLTKFEVSGNYAPDVAVQVIEPAYSASSTGRVVNYPGQGGSPRNWHTGGVPAQVSGDGTDTTPSITETYIAEVFIPCPATVTGIAVFNGSLVAGNIKLALANSAGVVLASTASTAASGTDAYQRVAFSAATSVSGPGTFYVLLQCSDTGYRFNSHTIGNFGASKKTGETYGTFTTVTAPTTFTTALGPIASLY